VVQALGLSMADLFEAKTGPRKFKFRVVGPNGIATHVREDLPNGEKKIRWEGLNGTPLAALPLYASERLPGEPATVYVVEGEKACEALLERGLHAVGTYGADVIPHAAAIDALFRHNVVLWPDNDAPGTEHMQKVAAVFSSVGQPVRWVSWPDAPPKGDAADFTGSEAEIVAMTVDLPPFKDETALAVPTTGTRLDVVRMSDVKPEPIEWLWRGRFARGKPTLLMGDPGLGKSLITHFSSAIVSTGGTWPDGETCERGSAILFTTEDGLADTVAPRLIAAGADMPRVLAVRGVLDTEADMATRMFALTEHLALLEQLIYETNAIFVSMDPISAYLGPDVNSHKESDVRAVLGPLSLLAERTRIVLVMLMHLNKGSGVSALYRACGSIAFPALARVVLGVAPDPNTEDGRRRLLLPIKMNIGQMSDGIGYRIEPAPPLNHTILRNVSEEDRPPVIAWDKEPVTIDAASALDRSGTAQEVGAAAEVKSVLKELLADGKVAATKCKAVIKEATGVISETTLLKAKRELGVKVRREGYGDSGTWYWEIPVIDSNPRARTLQPDSMESMESMEPSIPSIDSIDSKDSKDSMGLTRAREDFVDKKARRCQDCGEPTMAEHQSRCVDCRIKNGEIHHPNTGRKMIRPGVYETDEELPF
jgi:hypothetical protein